MTTFNRWFIPVGAVAVHICIGSVYAWSTFNRPIQALFPAEPWWLRQEFDGFCRIEQGNGYGENGGCNDKWNDR